MCERDGWQTQREREIEREIERERAREREREEERGRERKTERERATSMENHSTMGVGSMVLYVLVNDAG